jgi:hypothetical protein
MAGRAAVGAATSTALSFREAQEPADLRDLHGPAERRLLYRSGLGSVHLRQ